MVAIFFAGTWYSFFGTCLLYHYIVFINFFIPLHFSFTMKIYEMLSDYNPNASTLLGKLKGINECKNNVVV